MRYSIMLPPSDSLNWTILDDRGDVIFRGQQQQCEEWLDMADFSAATHRGSPIDATGEQSTPLPMFELATALLRRFWTDCSGEVRISGELPAILLMTVAMFCLSSQLAFQVVGQEISRIRGASALTDSHSESGKGVETPGEALCASSRTLDIACDAMDDSR